MKVSPSLLPEVLIIEPQVFSDERGYFMEMFNADRYRTAGIGTQFVQDNLSHSTRGVLRGLHFQHPNGQDKLVQCLDGEVFDVAVDVRRGSPRFGKWVSARLSSVNRRQLFVPAGFAHGFVVLSESALFQYKCSRTYDPASERSVRWDDPALGIGWPLRDAILSPKDAAAPLLADVPPEQLPAYG